MARRATPSRRPQDRAVGAPRDRRIAGLYRGGLTMAQVGVRVGLPLHGVESVLTRLGIPRRTRAQRYAVNAPRDRRIVALYRRGRSLHQIGDELGISWATAQGVLERRGVPRRTAADFRRAQAGRDAKIVALYRGGRSSRAVGEELGLTLATVMGVLKRRRVKRRAAKAYPSQPKGPWKRARRLVESVKHLYNTGPRTSALDLAKRVGLNAGTVRAHLKAMGLLIPNRSWMGSRLNAEKVRLMREDLSIDGAPLAELARRYDVAPSTVRGVAEGRIWKDVPWPRGGGYVRRPGRKLTGEKVRRIKAALVGGRRTLGEVARSFGVTLSPVWSVAMERTWKHIPWPDDRRYKRRHREKLTVRQVRLAKALLARGGRTHVQIGREMGIPTSVIRSIASGGTWESIPWPKGRRYRVRVHTKLTVEQVRLIKADLVAQRHSFPELARLFGVSGATITSIAMDRNWKHVPWPNKAGYVRRPRTRYWTDSSGVLWDARARTNAKGGGRFGGGRDRRPVARKRGWAAHLA